MMRNLVESLLKFAPNSTTLRMASRRANSSSTASTSSTDLFAKVKEPLPPTTPTTPIPEPPPTPPEPKSPVMRAVSLFSDTLFFSMLGGAIWSIYYSYQYTIPEVETQVNDLRTQIQLGGGGTTSSSSSSSSSSSPLDNAKLKILSTYLNARKFADERFTYYSAPTQDKLLPDTITMYGPYIGPQIRTLVLDLPHVLMHAEWSRDKGWRYYKRPGVDDFLRMANQLGWEVVVYTPATQMLGDPILDKLDPQRNLIVARLYRDQTQYVSRTGRMLSGGKHVCDLSRLNRDLSRTLFLSSDPDTFSFQPENAIKLSKWTGEPGDTTLLDLLPFLEMVVKTQAPDTRVIVKSYEGKDLVEEFKARMAALKVQKMNEGSGSGGGSGGRGRRFAVAGR